MVRFIVLLARYWGSREKNGGTLTNVDRAAIKFLAVRGGRNSLVVTSMRHHANQIKWTAQSGPHEPAPLSSDDKLRLLCLLPASRHLSKAASLFVETTVRLYDMQSCAPDISSRIASPR